MDEDVAEPHHVAEENRLGFVEPAVSTEQVEKFAVRPGFAKSFVRHDMGRDVLRALDGDLERVLYESLLADIRFNDLHPAHRLLSGFSQTPNRKLSAPARGVQCAPEVRMRSLFRPLALFPIIVLCLVGVVAGEDVLHHDLTITLDPDERRIDVVDLINPVGRVARDAEGAYRFVLHAGLAPEVVTSGWRLEPVEGEIAADFFGINATTATVEDTVPLEGWRLVPEDGAQSPVELRYGGVIHHKLEQQGEEYQRSFSETPGFIGQEGIFLAGTSFWAPTFGDALLTFELEVHDLPKGWEVISQGRRTRLGADAEGRTGTRWSFDHPTEEIYLVGGPLEVFEDRQGEVEVFAYLRSPDVALATRYLDATKRYLRLYNSMLPEFPFVSFALVENFWETGYGMPGFTLLGPRVIRFPWILTSSYPHELLHNWWGNSVYVDFDRGNWCEGLTVYMADHLLAEQRGEGQVYRRSTLKKFTDLVSADEDFPLVEFHSRNSAASEAVGYGKSMMLFHMMRRSVGDQKFLEGVTEFYDRQKFRRASFGDIAEAFAATGAGHWEDFVEAWTTRTGAPKLEIADVQVKAADDKSHPWLLEMEITQVVDGGDAFPLALPIAVTLEGRDEAFWVETGTCGGDCRVRVPCASKPLRVDVDPAFDVMRRLDPLEVPPAISTLMGADEVLFVLPSGAPADELAAWRDLASGWAAPAEARTVLDLELEILPESATWVLGWNNRFAGEVASRLEAQGVSLGAEGLFLPEEPVARIGHSAVLVARGETDPAVAVGWVGAEPVEAITGLARKAPHYQKYSYLAFKGEEPSNTTKGMWTPVGSPLVRNLSGGPLPELVLPKGVPLAELPPVYEAENFGKTVRFLADPALEGRGLGSEGLAKATDWVEQRLLEIGLSPAAGGMRQTWSYRGGEPERDMELVNLIAEIPGTDLALVNQPVVVVAHLDHLGRGWPDVREGAEGQVHPGADDNASGVAVLLELARALKAEGPRPRSIIFLVVTAEEVGLVGSRHFVKHLPEDVKPFAAVNLDTVGRLKEGALFVLNADTAREWRFIFMGVGYTTGAPVKIVTEPLDASDQGAFIEAGIPAIQLFTGPTADYHRPSDTIEKLDLEGMATVTEAAKETITYLADRTEALTVTINTSASEAPAPGGRPGGAPGGGEGGRRASLGTMPDFGHQGPGVKVQAVTPGSAAEKAGIVPGDIILELDGKTVEGLRSLSGILKARRPGDEAPLKILRGGEEIAMTVVLTAR